MTVGIEKVLRESILEWICNFGTAARPADAYYLQWHIGDPGVAGTTTKSTVLPDRDVLAGTTPFWAVGTVGDGVVQNSTSGESSAAIAGGPETISHFSVWSAAVAGSFLFSGTVTVPQPVDTGGKLTYAAGALTVTITGAA